MTTNKIGNFIIVEGETVEPFLLATSFNSKLKTDKNLIRSLQKANYRGKVFVDMLMKVGNASQRFYSSFFNGNNFEMNNTRVIENEYELLDILLKIERKIICQDKQILNIGLWQNEALYAVNALLKQPLFEVKQIELEEERINNFDLLVQNRSYNNLNRAYSHAVGQLEKDQQQLVNIGVRRFIFNSTNKNNIQKINF